MFFPSSALTDPSFKNPRPNLLVVICFVQLPVFALGMTQSPSESWDGLQWGFPPALAAAGAAEAAVALP